MAEEPRLSSFQIGNWKYIFNWLVWWSKTTHGGTILASKNVSDKKYYHWHCIVPMFGSTSKSPRLKFAREGSLLCKKFVWVVFSEINSCANVTLINIMTKLLRINLGFCLFFISMFFWFTFHPTGTILDSLSECSSSCCYKCGLGCKCDWSSFCYYKNKMYIFRDHQIVYSFSKWKASLCTILLQAKQHLL